MKSRRRTCPSHPILGIVFGHASCRLIEPGRVADRLMKPDMWSRWGIRTLSADHRSFNPFNYQTGAVWPHDNGLIAQGMKNYGFHDETCRIAEAITRAAGYFAMDQMPELYAGTQGHGSNFPSIWAPTCHRVGLPDRSSRFCKQCSASNPTRRTRCSTLIRPFQIGCRSSLSVTSGSRP